MQKRGVCHAGSLGGRAASSVNGLLLRKTHFDNVPSSRNASHEEDEQSLWSRCVLPHIWICLQIAAAQMLHVMCLKTDAAG